ncbi:hypothetical protein Psuf_020750 [Phytohabitans suffuscus]|uniref:Tyr recombinase domain-containing protein n=1 Tax=Phytohabitans suffuscus TaxID=624315 RepID=A0A6F8YF89_9ACTN|nr:hypothetical protein Psuf_020750 [Phytohabitans suffuscus]
MKPLTPGRSSGRIARDGLFALWWLAALRGLRRGEICGLRWVDLDLEGGALTAHQQVCQINGRVHIGPVKTPAGNAPSPLTRQRSPC